MFGSPKMERAINKWVDKTIWHPEAENATTKIPLQLEQ